MTMLSGLKARNYRDIRQMVGPEHAERYALECEITAFDWSVPRLDRPDAIGWPVSVDLAPVLYLEARQTLGIPVDSHPHEVTVRYHLQGMSRTARFGFATAEDAVARARDLVNRLRVHARAGDSTAYNAEIDAWARGR